MQRIKLSASDALSDEDVLRWKGRKPKAEAYAQLYTREVRLDKPDGSPLAVYLKGAVPVGLARGVLTEVRRLRSTAFNRFSAVGESPDGTPLRRYGVLKDSGGVSRTNALRFKEHPWLKDVISSIMGFFERVPRYPYCRDTKNVVDTPRLWDLVKPFSRHIHGLMKRHVPLREAAQAQAAGRTNPAWLIPGTPFTTVTINRNFQTACHQDAGDLAEGFSCLAVLRAGAFTGGRLVIPKYGVAFEMEHRDVLLMDAHEFHGNTALLGRTGSFERWSFVFYFRTMMQQCGTPEEELQRVKNRKRGEPLFGEAKPRKGKSHV